jgi:hypothetical protein
LQHKQTITKLKLTLLCSTYHELWIHKQTN